MAGGGGPPPLPGAKPGIKKAPPPAPKGKPSVPVSGWVELIELLLCLLVGFRLCHRVCVRVCVCACCLCLSGWSYHCACVRVCPCPLCVYACGFVCSANPYEMHANVYISTSPEVQPHIASVLGSFMCLCICFCICVDFYTSVQVLFYTCFRKLMCSRLTCICVLSVCVLQCAR